MKKITTLFIAIISIQIAFAQSTDTVNLGTNITKQAYYKLLDGSEMAVDNDDWDIAFQTGTAFSTCIMINPANGTELYVYPGDTTDWANLTDTTGISTWSQQYNADTNWEYGAFSRNQSGFDVGWGEYNMTTHEIIGHKIFVIKLANGVYQKIWIRSLIGGVYTFRHATLNNSMDMTHTIKKDDFPGKNFGYFSLQSHGELDKEPDSEEWDLYFGKYTAFVPTAYPVTGVLHNQNTTSSKAYPINDPSSYGDWYTHSLMNEINTIGYDWKSYDFQNNAYLVEDSTVYFVKTQHGDVFKLVFQSYGWDAGNMQATGEIVFNKSQVHYSGIETKEEIELYNVYPNPASDVISIAYHSNDDVQLQLMDLSGKVMMNERLSARNLVQNISVAHLEPGLYMMVFIQDQERITKRVVIQ